MDDGLRGGSMVRDVVERHPSDIMELQSMQLLAGKRADGTDLRPLYSEDLKPTGYFHTTDSAGRYRAWKATLSYPFSVQRENPDAPNLYVNGRFHSELGPFFGGQSMLIDGKTDYARGIVSKYGLGSFGLSATSWSAVFWERGAYDELMASIRSTLSYG